MNEELQGKLVEVLTNISENVTQAKDFAIEQLPDVAQQFIIFGMLWETTLFVIFVVLAMVGFSMVWKGYKLLTQKGNSSDEGFAYILIGSFLSTLTGIPAIVALKSVILVWFAPKLYLLQGIAELVK